MPGLNAAALGLILLTGASLVAANMAGPGGAVLAIAAAKALAILRWYARFDRASGGWRIAIVFYVLALCLALAALSELR